MKTNKIIYGFFVIGILYEPMVITSQGHSGAITSRTITPGSSALPGAAATMLAHLQSAAYKTCDVVTPIAQSATAAVSSYLQEWQKPRLQGSTEKLYVPSGAKLPIARSLKKTRAQGLSDSSNDSSSSSEQDAEFEFIESKKKSKQLPFATPKAFNDALQKDATGTMHSLNKAVEHYFQEQNPAELKTQTAIFATCSCLAKSEPAMPLPVILANKFNERQRQALIDAVAYEAFKVQPRIAAQYTLAINTATDKRDRTITKAQARYAQEETAAHHERDKKLAKSMNKVKTFAANAAYINSCAQQKQAHPAHDLQNFKDLQVYQSFLETIRKAGSDRSL